MVDKAFTDITDEVATPTDTAPDDLLLMTDVSDTTESVDGTSLKAQLKNLGAPVLLDRITNATAGNFVFSSIPGGYKRLIIKGWLESDAAGAPSDTVYIFFNSATTITDYKHQRLQGRGSAAVSNEQNNPQIVVVPGATGLGPATVHIELEGYADSTSRDVKCATSLYGHAESTATATVGAIVVQHNSLTDAITTLTIETNNHPTDQLVGELSLYGQM